MSTVIRFLKKILPAKLFTALLSFYHRLLPFLGSLIYRSPSKKLFVVGVTGTKGKSSTTELLNAIFEEAGFKTAVSGTIRFKVGKEETPNLYKMSMPGRFFMQRFLRKAVNAECTHAIIEMTSEGARQFRHTHIDMDALIFTNLSPEHIESHGSFEKYRDAKLSIADQLVASEKKDKYLVVNGNDETSPLFLSRKVDTKLRFDHRDAEPYILTSHSIEFTFENTKIISPLQGIFNLENILAAATLARALGIQTEVIKKAVETFSEIKGRVQKIHTGQNFEVVVDYAHTIDSLEKLYQAFPSKKKICVLGNTGGGRDKWKRPGMAKIAEKYCDEIVLTNEDPYDEDPQVIVDEMKVAIHHKPVKTILDRRGAIRYALSKATPESAVLITGKGTDPYIMGPRNTKIVWSDANVAREELLKMK